MRSHRRKRSSRQFPQRQRQSDSPTDHTLGTMSDDARRSGDDPAGLPLGWVPHPDCELVGPTVERLTRAAKAHVATAARRTACLHVSRAMQAARRRADFDFTSRLGRRAEAGPRRVLPRVRRHQSENIGPSCHSTLIHLLKNARYFIVAVEPYDANAEFPKATL